MNNNEKIDVFYIDKKSVWSIFVYTLLGIVPFFILIDINRDFFSSLYIQIILLFLLTVLFMCVHCNNITPNRINKRVIKHLSLVIGVLFLLLIPDESSLFLKKILLFQNKGNEFDIFIYFLVGLAIVVNAIEKKHDNKTETEYYFIVGIIIAINIINIFTGWNLIFYLIKLTIEIALIVKIIRKLRNKKFIEEGKVNFLYVVTFSIFFSVIVCEDALGIDLFARVLAYIFLVCMCVASFLVIVYLREILYRDRFLEKTIMDEELAKINNKILIKNLELEEYHKINKERQRAYREFLRKVPKPIVIIYRSTNRIVYSNEKFLELTSLHSLREIINVKINSIIDIEFDVFKDKDSSVKKTSLIGDSEKILECSIIQNELLQDEIVLIFDDITDQLRYKEIKEKIEKKEMRSKVKKNFLSNISHDLKLPINVIYSAVQLQKLFIEQGDIESVVKYNNISKENCITLTKLTNNLLDISKISSEHLYPILRKRNIVEFVETCVQRFIQYAENKDIELIFDTEEEEVYMYYDEEFIERIIMNLIYNSLKFTPNGGNILVDIKIDEENVYLIVEDNGLGMSEEFTKNIFNKYSMEKNDSNVNGSGVGLFVVYNLVKLQKGNILVESKLNQGSRFTISFSREKDEEIYGEEQGKKS